MGMFGPRFCKLDLLSSISDEVILDNHTTVLIRTKSDYKKREMCLRALKGKAENFLRVSGEQQ